MTTDDAPRFTADVFVEGGEVFLPYPADAPKPRIAALSFVRKVNGSLRATRRDCLANALSALGGGPFCKEARLLIGASRPQPDGARMRSMSKLKGAHLEQAFADRDWVEVLVVGAEGLKWVADFPVDSALLDVTEALMVENPYSSIVVGRSAPVVHHFLDHGWSRSDEWFRASDSHTQFIRDTVLIGALENLLVIRVFGASDDRVASADIIGAASRVEELWRSVADRGSNA